MPHPRDILANADRLVSDARFLREGGRSRSAAALIIFAFEQMGSFVEALTLEKYPNATLHMGIFGNNANAHARRQDALAAYVMNVAMGDLTMGFCWELFWEKTFCCGDPGKFYQWLEHSLPIEFTAEQKQRMRDSAELRAASLLLRFVRQNDLKKVREYGLYEDASADLSAGVIQKFIELAEQVREILKRSPELVTPVPMGMVGVNIPENSSMDEFREVIRTRFSKIASSRRRDSSA